MSTIVSVVCGYDPVFDPPRIFALLKFHYWSWFRVIFTRRDVVYVKSELGSNISGRAEVDGLASSSWIIANEEDAYQ